MFRIARDTRISIVSLATPSGGAESLHQLSHELRGAGRDARVVYLPVSDRTPPDYARYDVVLSDTIEDRPNDVVVVPEGISGYGARFRSIQRAIWWLSVDNHLRPGVRRFDFAAPGSDQVRHLVATAYARDFVERSGGTLLADLNAPVDVSFAARAPASREDLVLFNPKKSQEQVERLMSRAPDLAWTPIRGFDRAGVQRLMSRAKVFVEFGPFPGRERMPREAALAGCCVVTGMRGAAAFHADLPLPARYKFDDRAGLSEATLDAVIETIRECLRGHEGLAADFDELRALTFAQNERFPRAVREMFAESP